MLYGFLLLLSCGRSHDHGEELPVDGAEVFLRFSALEHLYLAYYFGMLLWAAEFCHSLSLFAVAYTTEVWHFRDRDDDEYRADTGAGGILAAYCVALRHHLGTLCCGSFCIMIARPLRMVMEIVDWASDDDENSACICLREVCLCAIMCHKRWLEYVHKNAYPDVAMNSIGFCTRRRSSPTSPWRRPSART